MKKVSELLKFDEKGLIPAIIQDKRTKKVLTLCYMNKEALERTLKEGKIYLFRRSRGMLMMKGGTSGCIQRVREFLIDCEGNSLLFIVNQVKAACHTGHFTCYYRTVDEAGKVKVLGRRLFDPKYVYVR